MEISLNSPVRLGLEFYLDMMFFFFCKILLRNMIYVVQIFINVLILEIILLVYTRLSLSLFIDISP